MNKLKIILAALDETLLDAWRSAFAEVSQVDIFSGSILDVNCDAIVSPANSFGFMDGGIDAIYSEHFGWDLQLKLRRKILDQHHGELLVGSAEIVETGNNTHPFLIAAPTMRVPMALPPESINPYLATRAALLLLKFGQYNGQSIANLVKTIAFPGMGTGVGRVPAKICAHQMKAAINECISDQLRLPTSWAEASERHQLLYTDKPKRLQ